MNEYESLGTGAISANLVTDVNTLDNFIVSIVKICCFCFNFDCCCYCDYKNRLYFRV